MSSNVSTGTATKKPTSHDWARNVHAFADFLLSRPAFEISWGSPTETRSMSFYFTDDKDKFLAAAKALGSGTKTFSDNEVRFTVAREWGKLEIRAPRNLVCRLIRPAEYECDPLLSPEEEKQLGGAL